MLLRRRRQRHLGILEQCNPRPAPCRRYLCGHHVILLSDDPGLTRPEKSVCLLPDRHQRRVALLCAAQIFNRVDKARRLALVLCRQDRLQGRRLRT